jgi:predicted nucleic acid-binding Zn ribbon protein
VIYLYRRGEETIEQDFPMGEAPPEVEVEGHLYRRVYTVPGLQFRGSGFYTTDNRGPYMDPEIRRGR